MFKIIVFTLVATVTVGVAWWLAGLPGHLDMTLAGYSVRMASSLALVALALIALVLVALLRLIGWIIDVPLRLGRWRSRQRRSSGDEAITRTLVAIAAGAESEARQQAERARRMLGDTPQTLLLAAEARRLGNREDEAAALYKQLAERDDAALLGLRGLFRQALNRQDWAEAAGIARRAEAVYPSGAWLRDERTQLAIRTGNWAAALKLAGPETPRDALATAAAEAEPDARVSLRLAKQAWQAHPGFAPAALAYAKRLRDSGKAAKAFGVIAEAWRVAPQPDLAEFWLSGIADPAERLREGERLVASNADHAESHLLLGKLALAAGQHREARRHLEAARVAGVNQRRLFVLLADLEAAQRGESEEGRIAQRDALRQAATAEPDPRWRCEACGVEHAHWLPSCPSCHAAGRIRWGAPKLALAAPEPAHSG